MRTAVQAAAVRAFIKLAHASPLAAKILLLLLYALNAVIIAVIVRPVAWTASWLTVLFKSPAQKQQRPQRRQRWGV